MLTYNNNLEAHGVMNLGKYCVITCHDFTGYPEEMEPFGEFMEKKGLNWYNLLLPGHGTNPFDLKNIRWIDWANYVRKEVNVMMKKYPDGVFFAGLSLGGVITLYVLQQFPDLKGAITLSAPVRLLNWWQTLLAKIPYLGFWVKRTEKDEKLLFDKEAAKIHRGYETFHTDSAKQVNKLVTQVRKRLDIVNQPTLIIHSSKDNLIPVKNAHEIFDKISSFDKEKLIVENSGHVLTRDFDKEEIFEKSFEFIKQTILE